MNFICRKADHFHCLQETH